VVFVLEILMLDITAGSVIPLLIASITATTMAFMLRGFDPILAVTLQPQDAFELWQIPLFILLGVCCGLMSWYFNLDQPCAWATSSVRSTANIRNGSSAAPCWAS